MVAPRDARPRPLAELALEAVGKRSPRALVPVPVGETVKAVAVTAADLQPMLVAALGAPYVAPGAPPPSQVIWYDHDGEVLVHLERTVVALHPGAVGIGLQLQNDESGVGLLSVVFGVGTRSAAAGLVVAAETHPRGPLALVDRWGETVTAAAWRALLDVAHAVALHAGVDSSGARLVPAAISASAQKLTVTPQARHAIDAVTGR